MTWHPEYVGPGPTRVAGLGDSIMHLTNDELTSQYSQDPFRWANACWWGISTQSIVTAGWARDLAATCPKHVIIIAGTNDVVNGSGDDWGWAALMAQYEVLTSLGPNTTVHWVKTYANNPGYLPGLQQRVAKWNEALDTWRATFPNLRTIDWPTCVYYFTLRGITMLEADGIHPTVQGQQLLAYIIGQSVLS